VVALCETPIEKAPYPSCQAKVLDFGKFSWIHFDEPGFNNWTAFATETVRGKETSK
jgi:hypothetical protein